MFDLQEPRKQWWEIPWTPESVNFMDPNLVVHEEEYHAYQDMHEATPPICNTPSAWSDDSWPDAVGHAWVPRRVHMHDRIPVNLLEHLDLPERRAFSPLNADGSPNVHAHPQHGDPASLISTTTETHARARRWGEPMRLYNLPLDTTFGGEWSSDGEEYEHVQWSAAPITLPGEVQV